MVRVPYTKYQLHYYVKQFLRYGVHNISSKPPMTRCNRGIISFSMAQLINKTRKMPNGIMDGFFTIILEQATYSGRNKGIFLKKSK